MELPFKINANEFCKFPELGYSNECGGIRTTDGFKYDSAVSAAWLQENKIIIFIQIIDKYFGTASMIFAFKGKEATVTATKRAEDFLWNYEGEANAHIAEESI